MSVGDFPRIEFGDEISVKKGARAMLTSGVFAFELFKGASFHLQALNGPELPAVLDSGHLHFSFKEDTGGRLRLETPNSKLTSIGDTRFTVCQPTEGKTCLVVKEGAVELIYQGGRETYEGDGTIIQGACVTEGEAPGPTVCIPNHEFEAWLEQARLDETSPPLGQLVNQSVECGRQSRTAWTSVPGIELWTNTGVDVKAGDTLRIEAGGAIAHGGGGPLIFPDGDPTRLGHESNLPGVRNTNHASLIGKIGEDGTAFLVGSTYEVVTETGGRLFLGVNDIGVDNNDGEFFAVITVVSS